VLLYLIVQITTTTTYI